MVNRGSRRWKFIETYLFSAESHITRLLYLCPRLGQSFRNWHKIELRVQGRAGRESSGALEQRRAISVLRKCTACKANAVGCKRAFDTFHEICRVYCLHSSRDYFPWWWLYQKLGVIRPCFELQSHFLFVLFKSSASCSCNWQHQV